MFCSAYINDTNFNQDGTILDEFNFRYEIHGKYDSTDVKISTFINDINKRCINEFKIIDFNNPNKKYLLHSLIDETCQQKFKTMKDLCPYVQIFDQLPRTRWIIKLEGIPDYNESPDLKAHVINSIPQTMLKMNSNINSVDHDHTSIEWNDFNSFIFQYCTMCEEYYSNTIIAQKLLKFSYPAMFGMILEQLCFPSSPGGIFNHIMEIMKQKQKIAIFDNHT